MLNANDIVHWLEDERGRVEDALADDKEPYSTLSVGFEAQLELIGRLLKDIGLTLEHSGPCEQPYADGQADLCEACQCRNAKEHHELCETTPKLEKKTE